MLSKPVTGEGLARKPEAMADIMGECDQNSGEWINKFKV